MENHSYNIQNCIRIYIQCLERIRNIELNDNIINIINRYINTLQLQTNNINNMNNVNNILIERLDYLFFSVIHTLTIMCYNDINNYIIRYNHFHSRLMLFHNDIIHY